MILTGKTEFTSKRDGIKKDGSPWYSVKFLDRDADEFFTAFVDEHVYQSFEKLSKGAEVILTLNLVPGQKYFSVTDYVLDV